jgi:hypothetical protein
VTVCWRETLPDVPLTVIVYDPAGVPPVAGGVDELLPPHADWNIIVPSSVTRHIPNNHLRRRELVPTPTAINASPETGKNIAYHTPERGRTDVVVTGRAVVEIVIVELAGLVLGNVMLVVENEQLAPKGSPDEHDSDTLFGYLGSGVTVTSYCTGGC